MTSSSLALVDLLAHIHDFRQSSGKRYSLTSILALAVAAMLCGFKSYSAIAQWGRIYGNELALALGFKDGKTPCAATFCNIFSRLDRLDLETKLASWTDSLQILSQEEDYLEAVSLDGKSLRGSKKQGAPAAHLLSALGHRLGLTLFQVAVEDHTNEIGTVKQLLDSLILKDKLITTDALLTQREVAQTIVQEGGHYIQVVKENHPSLLAQCEAAIEAVAFYPERKDEAKTEDCCHGRIEERRIITSSVLEDCPVWPGMKQVFKIERRVIEKKTGKESQWEVYGVTSLTKKQARAEKVLEAVRGHWSIENKSHWVRDVIYEEDRSQVRKGSTPQVMAALRNTAIGLMRWSGERCIAAACRRFAAQPWAALALIGISVEN